MDPDGVKKKARRHQGTKARSGKKKAAFTFDRFSCYELAVTNPKPLARFLRASHGGTCRVLGEDFSGTGALSRAWVDLNPKHKAIVVDNDPDPLSRIPKHPRLKSVWADVLKATNPCDVIAATNFPICYCHTRRDLLRYLRHIRTRLKPRGIFVADLYGGSDAFTPGKTTVKLRRPDSKALWYTWEQRTADPMTCRVLNALHFRTQDRGKTTQIKDAFIYDWRLWSIPELTEAIIEAGFQDVDIYDRLGDAIDQHGNVMIQPADDLDDPYVVYVVART